MLDYDQIPPPKVEPDSPDGLFEMFGDEETPQKPQEEFSLNLLLAGGEGK